jgi:hypothetical protein
MSHDYAENAAVHARSAEAALKGALVDMRRAGTAAEDARYNAEARQGDAASLGAKLRIPGADKAAATWKSAGEETSGLIKQINIVESRLTALARRLFPLETNSPLAAAAKSSEFWRSAIGRVSTPTNSGNATPEVSGGHEAAGIRGQKAPGGVHGAQGASHGDAKGVTAARRAIQKM